MLYIAIFLKTEGCKLGSFHMWGCLIFG